MTQEEYWEKLLRLPEQFNQAMHQQKYSRAKYIYDTAIRVVEFMNPPDEIRKQLFGDWDNNEVEISEGLFHKDLVSEAYEQCTIKRYQDYEHESYRRFGQPPQYYPQPRYPVPGYPKPK